MREVRGRAGPQKKLKGQSDAVKLTLCIEGPTTHESIVCSLTFWSHDKTTKEITSTKVLREATDQIRSENL